MLSNLLIGQTAFDPLYVEDVFSTYLYTGNGGTQTITNGIDLAGKGGLVWLKRRSSAGQHTLWDTNRGVGNFISSNLTDANTNLVAGTGTNNYDLNAFNSNGFGLGIDAFFTNTSGTEMCAWTFRKAPKFFDVVTWTANGSAQNINHSLGIQPGMIIVKATSGTSNWFIWHIGSGVATSRSGLSLNTTNASAYSFDVSSSITSTSFNTLYINDHAANTPTNNGVTYVAYLFAHDPTADGVIQCGSFTTDASGNVGTINLGWEPQYILCKASSATQGWYVFDTMRGWTASGNTFGVQPNASSAELDYSGGTKYLIPTATGFTGAGNFFGVNTTVVYMAIRRGPMRVPTDATKVFSPNTRTGDGIVTTNFPVDLSFMADRDGSGPYTAVRLIGGNYMNTTSTAAETSANWWLFQSNTTFGDTNGIFGPAARNSFNSFQRAPGFMDVVCYTGTGSAQNVAHNLGVIPEMMIVKARSSAGTVWLVYSASLGGTYRGILNTNSAFAANVAPWNDTNPTSSVFTVGVGGSNPGTTYVAYLFATCPGVSKVGNYTGAGSTQTINCGFSGGARFVMIKRTDDVGSWWFWDTARGMVSGSDPRLQYNSVSAEINNDWVYTTTGGFQIVTSDATVNANGGSYIYLAIA